MFSKNITVAYTVEKCDSCNVTIKRRYRAGDVLFNVTGSCKCGESLYVDSIYGESVKK